MDTKNYILLGPPGSGKSTQADFFKARLHLTHIDMGGELRAIATEESLFGKEVYRTIYVKRELATDEVVRQALGWALAKADPKKGVVLDGAPRRESQIKEVIDILAEYGRDIDGVIFIDLPKEVSIDRISRRFSCEQCGEKFVSGMHPEDHAEPCFKCGGKLVQRKDDTPAGVENRWRIFHEDTEPVIRHFESEGKLLHVDGTLPAEDIFQQIEQSIV
ncbi:MAG: nucleoside monophosphate kinase [Candidatus Moraniibacteriota bacterium]